MLAGKEILTGPPGLSKDGSYIILALSEVFQISKPDGSKCFLCSSVSLFSAIGKAVFTWILEASVGERDLQRHTAQAV